MAKKIVYATIMTGMIINNKIFALNVGFFHLHPFRACILLLIFLLFKDLLKEEKIKINKRKENYYSIGFMTVWVFYAFFSLAWVRDYTGWSKSLYFLVIGLIIYIGFSKYLIEKSDIVKAFRATSIIMGIHMIIGWYEIFTSNYLFLALERVGSYTKNNYPVSSFTNVNDYATFMLFSVCVSYICLMNAKSKASKGLYSLSLISSVLLIGASKSRANLLGLIISIMIFVILSIRYKETRYGLLILFSVAFVVVLFKPEILTNLISYINENLNFNFSSESGSDGVRVNLIKNGIYFLTSTLGFGVGSGNIEYWMEYRARNETFEILNMHNWWAEILVAYGFIIFVLYLVFYVKLFVSFYRKYKFSKDKVDRFMSLGIMCFMVGFVIGSMSSSSNIGSQWLWVFWGVAVAYQGIVLKPNNRLE